jgi:hypothetical protein
VTAILRLAIALPYFIADSIKHHQMMPPSSNATTIKAIEC